MLFKWSCVVSPSKALAIQWCAESWENISKTNIVNGCKKCFMNPGVPDTEVENYRGQNLDDIDWAAENLKIWWHKLNWIISFEI